MEFTGERYVPGAGGDELHHLHAHRYRFAAALASERRVLDIGAGEGYGTAMLRAAGAADALGLDIDPAAVAHAAATYAAAGLRFAEGRATDLPIADASVDLVTAFEVIEHLDDPAALVREAHRVLAPGGLVVVSTPDKPAYNATMPAANPFHRHEMSCAEFRALLTSHFPAVATFAQRPASVSLITPMADSDRPPVLEALHNRAAQPLFVIAVCAHDAARLPGMGASLFFDAARQDAAESLSLVEQLRRARTQLDAYEASVQELAAALRAADAEVARLRAAGAGS